MPETLIVPPNPTNTNVYESSSVYFYHFVVKLWGEIRQVLEIIIGIPVSSMHFFGNIVGSILCL